MKRLKYFWVLIFLLVSSVFTFTTAQQQHPFYYNNFSQEDITLSTVKGILNKEENTFPAVRPSYAQGIKGKALDLSADVDVRIPLVLENKEVPNYNKSFSVSTWIKANNNSLQGTPIISSKKHNDARGKGWTLGTQENGAWFFQISDGNALFDYYPSAQRQAINDGKWHHIVASINMKDKTLWLFFDGINVAIYNIDGLSSIVNDLRTVVGGTDEYNDWGSRGEWTAFNGLIDNIALYDVSLPSDIVEDMYLEYSPSKPTKVESMQSLAQLKVQTWNIWHGGKRFGENVGVQRVIDVLKDYNADIIGLVETYGSGTKIAESLGYYYYLISSNLSIMSRYPIARVIKYKNGFLSGSAEINLGNGESILFTNLWIDYLPGLDYNIDVEEFLAEDKKRRQTELSDIMSSLKNEQKSAIAHVVAGDFNSGSHLDWTEETRSIHYGLKIDWGTSKLMMEKGYVDSFRELHPDPLMVQGITWSPLMNYSSEHKRGNRDRIDFIYYKGKNIMPVDSKVIDNYGKSWPSDHASVLTTFYKE